MSSARRLLVLLGFALMVAGILLLLSQEEEIFVALSVVGFVVVVAAVPRLQREGAEPSAGAEPARAVESGAQPATAAQPSTGNVTVVPSEPTREQPAVADLEASGDGREPQPEPSAPPAEPEPAAPDPSEGVEPAPAFAAPAQWGTWRPPAPAAHPQTATRPRQPSPRTAAIGAGTALGAGALLWALRRMRR